MGHLAGRMSWRCVSVVAVVSLLSAASLVRGNDQGANFGQHHGRDISYVDFDPEFVAVLKGVDTPICFHMETPGSDVIRLIQDPVTGVIVNGQIFNEPHSNKSFIGAIMIARDGFQMVAKARFVSVNNKRYKWGTTRRHMVEGNTVTIGEDMAAVTFHTQSITIMVRHHYLDSLDDWQDLDTNNDVIKDEDLFTDFDAKDGDNDDGTDSQDKNDNEVIGGGGNRQTRYNHRNKILYPSRNKRRGLSKDRSGSGHGKHHRGRGDIFDLHPERPRSLKSRRSDQKNETSEPKPEGTKIQSNRTVYMGLYVTESTGFSNLTHGLMGQFYYKSGEVERAMFKDGVYKARLTVSNRKPIVVTAKKQLNRNINVTRACWKVRNQGLGVIDGQYIDYKVPTLRAMRLQDLPPTAPT